MSNLLQETLSWIERVRHSPADVVYIGSRDGYSCTWDEFTRLADREYDDGFGRQEVADDLEIHFSDGGWLERSEYDGAESWSYRAPFVRPAELKPIERLMRDDDHCGTYLASLHEDEDDW